MVTHIRKDGTTVAPDTTDTEQAGADSQAGPGAADDELAAIEREAQALEGQAGATAAAAPAVATNTASELREALGLVRVMAAPGFSDWPEFGVQVWNDQQLQAIADSGGAIMDRHGLSMGELWSTWGPYIALVGAVAGPSLATWQHIKLRRHLAEQRERLANQQRTGQAGQQAQQGAPA